MFKVISCADLRDFVRICWHLVSKLSRLFSEKLQHHRLYTDVGTYVYKMQFVVNNMPGGLFTILTLLPIKFPAWPVANNTNSFVRIAKPHHIFFQTVCSIRRVTQLKETSLEARQIPRNYLRHQNERKIEN